MLQKFILNIKFTCMINKIIQWIYTSLNQLETLFLLKFYIKISWVNIIKNLLKTTDNSNISHNNYNTTHFLNNKKCKYCLL